MAHGGSITAVKSFTLQAKAFPVAVTEMHEQAYVNKFSLFFHFLNVFIVF